nr:hypothetical protein [Tanacetum cinerariifolium]
MRRVGKGFSGVDTPLFEGMLVPQQVHDNVADDVADVVADADAEPTPPSPTPATTPLTQQELIPSSSQVESTPLPSPHQSSIAQPSSPPPQEPPSHDAAISMDLLNQLLETCATLTKKVGDLEQDKIAQAIEITKLKKRVRKLEKKRKLKASGLNRLRKVGTTQRVESLADTDDEADAAELKELIEVVTTTKLMIEVVTTTATTITVALMPKASAARRRKGVVIRDPKETATPSVILHYEPKSKDKGKGILVEEPKSLKKQAQIEQDEAYAKEEDLEILWKIIQERFASSEPKNFLDDFLLNTLKTMFEKPNVEAHIWKNERGSYGLAKVKSWKLLESCGIHIIIFTTTQMILLVKRRYPLTRFTLDQMLNNVNIKFRGGLLGLNNVLISFILMLFSFGVDAVEDFKEYMLRDYYCCLKTYCCWVFTNGSIPRTGLSNPIDLSNVLAFTHHRQLTVHGLRDFGSSYSINGRKSQTMITMSMRPNGGETIVPTGSGSIPTAGPPATIVSTTSPTVRRRKGKEILVESDTPKKKKLQE